MVDLAHFPKRVILIQQDYDGRIHAVTTDPNGADLEIWNGKDEEGIYFTVPYWNESDLETWSNWCHAALMMFHSENREYSELVEEIEV